MNCGGPWIFCHSGLHFPLKWSNLVRCIMRIFLAEFMIWRFYFLFINFWVGNNCSKMFIYQFSSGQFSCSVMSDSLWLMACSTTGFQVHHQLPELTQTHVHQVGDVIQASPSQTSPSPPAFNLSQHWGLFQGLISSHEVAEILVFQLQYQSFQWLSKTDFLYDGLVGSPCSPRDSQESSPTPQSKASILQCSAFFIVEISHLYDYWRKQLWLDGRLLAK